MFYDFFLGDFLLKTCRLAPKTCRLAPPHCQQGLRKLY